jgi:hypothetical protein
MIMSNRTRANLAQVAESYRRHNHGVEWRHRAAAESYLIQARMLVRRADERLEVAMRLAGVHS